MPLPEILQAFAQDGFWYRFDYKLLPERYKCKFLPEIWHFLLKRKVLFLFRNFYRCNVGKYKQ